MDPVVLVASFSAVELGVLALIGLTLLVPVVLALLLERFVYKGRAADPVGFAEFERRFENEEMWTQQLHEDRED